MTEINVPAPVMKINVNTGTAFITKCIFSHTQALRLSVTLTFLRDLTLSAPMTKHTRCLFCLGHLYLSSSFTRVTTTYLHIPVRCQFFSKAFPDKVISSQVFPSERLQQLQFCFSGTFPSIRFMIGEILSIFVYHWLSTVQRTQQSLRQLLNKLMKSSDMVENGSTMTYQVNIGSRE